MKRIIIALLIISSISLVYAFPIALRPLDSTGNLQPNKNFSYQFNFTSSPACTGVILSNYSTIQTDSSGIGFLDINISGISSIPLFLCEYRGNSSATMTLRKVHSFSDEIFGKLYAQSGNFTNNVTANWFKGKINYSDIQNVPVTGVYNATYDAYIIANQSNNTAHLEGRNTTLLGSFLESNFGWITNAVSNLINYYTKSEVYNKTEIASFNYSYVNQTNNFTQPQIFSSDVNVSGNISLDFGVITKSGTNVSIGINSAGTVTEKLG